MVTLPQADRAEPLAHKVLVTQVPALILKCVPEEDATAAVLALREADTQAETRERP